jgi:hypothetical protein
MLRQPLRLALIALVLGVSATGLARNAHAATNMTGVWQFDFGGAPGPAPIPCPNVTMKQHGTKLHLLLSCPPSVAQFTGTFDKGTGAFSVEATYACKGYVDVPWTLSGTVAPGGNTLTGVSSIFCIAPISSAFTGELVAGETATPQPPTLGGVASRISARPDTPAVFVALGAGACALVGLCAAALRRSAVLDRP